MHPLVFLGSPTWARTRDLRINSPSLYRLSYQGTEKEIIATLFLSVKHFEAKIDIICLYTESGFYPIIRFN